ncbi:hypothetical protein AAZX31_08G284700 [Glycine max]|uniref:DUF7815 domain-containing protein n=3 Tax=Glycine soja TaxID=3848 RepID=A0A0B2Q0Z3_GLYSO|nr:mucin-21-like isoform X1 [Glycine soja]KHN13472.1 hypothetical protein glysoja_029573 [Glycine soja]RZB99439.1 hypothetical protein D0Y65_022048 [Glycine soja]
MACEMPLDLIKHLRILLRREANLSWYDPEKEENLALPKLPSVAETIAKLDPSPNYLRCKNCNGKLIRDLQSSICVFCGTNSQNELPPEPIKFKSTIGYRWLLESLQLDGSDMVAPVVDENEWKRGRSELKDEIPLSELLDLEIRWPSEAERAQTSTSDLAAQGKSSLNLAGVDLDSFFDRRESDSEVYEQNLASGRQVGGASDKSFQANENLSLFQNVQALEAAAGSAENQSGDSFSSWETSFMSASSGSVHEMPKSVYHSKVELDMTSGFSKDSVGVKKNDDFNPSASTEDDYFQGGWRTFNSEVHGQTGKSESIMDPSGIKTAENANGSSRNLDWMQDDLWQGSDNKTTDTVPTAEDKDSFDEWNDFTGSGSTQDPSSTISNSKTTAQTGNVGYSVDFNDTKTSQDANSSSNKDFDWMQDQWQDNNNKTTNAISGNEAADAFDAWNNFTGSANTQHSSFGLSNSEITGQAGKFEFSQDHNDTKTAESATGSSSNFDWMQDNQWQGSDDKATGIVTTNEASDEFDAWNDFTGSAISQNPSSGVSDSAITAQTRKSEVTADLNDMKTEEGTNASSCRSFDRMQDDQWQVSNNKTTVTRTTNDIDSFDVWNDFTSLASTQDHSSNVWKQTVNPTSAEMTSETNLLSSSNSSHDKDFSGFSQHDLFSGQFGSSLPVTSSNRVDEVDITRGNSGDVSSAGGSKDGVEMLLSQMHDLSFMLENNLSIPPK